MLPLPRLPAHPAGCWGPPPMCCGRGCLGVGAQHCPLGLHALWRLRAAEVVGGRPRGGWPATVVRGVWCQALSLLRPPVLWSGQPGFRDPCVPGAVSAGVGNQHRPHSVRPCGPALLSVGVAEGPPRGGGAFHHCEGRLRSGAVPPLTASPLGGLLWSATHVLCGCVGVGAVNSHIVSLSQAEQNPHSTIGPIVHVFRVVHHSALPLRWSSVVHGLKSKLPFIPGLKLFAILRPLPNIKRLFRRWALRALQQPIGS